MSSVSSFRPPEGGQPVVAIYTTPSLMRKLVAFLKHFDRPPQQVFLEFVFLEVAEDDLAEFRYNVQHPLLYRLLGRTPPGSLNPDGSGPAVVDALSDRGGDGGLPSRPPPDAPDTTPRY